MWVNIYYLTSLFLYVVIIGIFFYISATVKEFRSLYDEYRNDPSEESLVNLLLLVTLYLCGMLLLVTIVWYLSWKPST